MSELNSISNFLSQLNDYFSDQRERDAVEFRKLDLSSAPEYESIFQNSYNRDDIQKSIDTVHQNYHTFNQEIISSLNRSIDNSVNDPLSKRPSSTPQNNISSPSVIQNVVIFFVKKTLKLADQYIDKIKDQNEVIKEKDKKIHLLDSQNTKNISYLQLLETQLFEKITKISQQSEEISALKSEVIELNERNEGMKLNEVDLTNVIKIKENAYIANKNEMMMKIVDQSKLIERMRKKIIGLEKGGEVVVVEKKYGESEFEKIVQEKNKKIKEYKLLATKFMFKVDKLSEQVLKKNDILKSIEQSNIDMVYDIIEEKNLKIANLKTSLELKQNEIDQLKKSRNNMVSQFVQTNFIDEINKDFVNSNSSLNKSKDFVKKEDFISEIKNDLPKVLNNNNYQIRNDNNQIIENNINNYQIRNDNNQIIENNNDNNQIRDNRVSIIDDNDPILEKNLTDIQYLLDKRKKEEIEMQELIKKINTIINN